MKSAGANAVCPCAASASSVSTSLVRAIVPVGLALPAGTVALYSAKLVSKLLRFTCATFVRPPGGVTPRVGRDPTVCMSPLFAESLTSVAIVTPGVLAATVSTPKKWARQTGEPALWFKMSGGNTLRPDSFESV